MSFLKITDPTKREASVKEFLDLKNRIKDNFRRERVGEIEMQSDLSNFFKPITETQKATTKEITEQLKPIREGIEGVPQQAITFPAFPSVELPQEKILTFGKIATDALYNLTEAVGVDRTFGIHPKNKKFHIGGKPIVIKDNNIIVEDEEYKGTPGLWELITAKEPKKIYTDEDLEEYRKLLLKTNAMYRNYDPTNPYPAATSGYKFQNLIKPIWDEETAEQKEQKKQEKKKKKRKKGNKSYKREK